MSTQIRLRRGTTAQHAAFTGALAEVTVDTDKKTAVVHDGGTAGGIPLAREDGKNDGALGYQQDVKTNDYTVLVGDIGKALVANKATAINFPLSAAATLTSKFVAIIKNIGLGTLTITPNGAELIDGVNAAISVPTNASLVIKGDGSSFRTFVSNGDVTATAIHNAVAKTVLADADEIGVVDTAASNVLKKVTLANLAISALVSAHAAFGQCRLVLSGGNLVLQRWLGALLTINGSPQLIPSAGVSLAPAGATPATLYYIYAFMNAGTMTLERSATGYSVDTATGVAIKTGDATRTLVGMAYPETGPVFTDTAKKRFVRSWFNDPGVSLFNNFTANRTTTSLTYVELNTEIRCEFLSWLGEVVQAMATGNVINGAANGQNRTSLAFDGTTTEPGGSQITLTNSDTVTFSTPAIKSGLSEGYHYATLIGLVASGTGTWYGDIDGRRTAISARVSR
jgi:hypothetical protein